jgi:aryl carrier-like protein/pimeloyl-ACP methyl ester carboxylesterase
MGACFSINVNLNDGQPSDFVFKDQDTEVICHSEISEPDLVKLVEKYFKATLDIPHKNFDLDTNFFDAGGDSLSAIKLIMALRQSIAHCQLSLQQLVESPTIRSLSEFLSQSQKQIDTEAIALPSNFIIDGPLLPLSLSLSEKLQSRLAFLGPAHGASRMQVLCLNESTIGNAPLIFLNPAGASALAYRELAQHLVGLNPNTPIYSLDDGCILSPKGASTHYPFETISELVMECESIVTEIARIYSGSEDNTSLQVTEGLSIAGWSWGGTVAVALAHSLTQKYRHAFVDSVDSKHRTDLMVRSLIVMDGPVTRSTRFDKYAEEGAGVILDTKRALAALPNSFAPPVDGSMVLRTTTHYAACTQLMRTFCDSSGLFADRSCLPLMCPVLDLRPSGLTEDADKIAALTYEGGTRLATLGNPSHFTMILGPSALEAAHIIHDFLSTPLSNNAVA